jgi:hypothetical protein
MEVIIGTGKDTATWTIPKALLSQHSEFFRAACNGPFKEGLENKITIPDVDARNSQVFVQWLYFVTLPAKWEVRDNVYDPFRLWICGDRISAPAFQDCDIGQLYDDYAFFEGYGRTL